MASVSTSHCYPSLQSRECLQLQKRKAVSVADFVAAKLVSVFAVVKVKLWLQRVRLQPQDQKAEAECHCSEEDKKIETYKRVRRNTF